MFSNTPDLAMLMMSKTAITNALIFDGYSLLRNHTLAIENDLIIGLSSLEDVFGAKVIDGAGPTLLPGLLDTHVHLSIDPDDSARLPLQSAKAGITTALDMGFLPALVRDNLRAQCGIADFRSAGNFANSMGSIHSRFPHVTTANIVDTPELAINFVEERIAEGAGYIKIFADVPGQSQEVVNVLAAEARNMGN